MKYYAVIVNGNVRELMELSQEPEGRLLMPDFGAQYLDAEGVTQIPLVAYRLVSFRETRTRLIKYYTKIN
jgi:hypothetical protein